MELARQEFKMGQKPNYGEKLYQSFKKRDAEPQFDKRPPKPRVFDHLQLQPVVSGTLDGTRAIQELSEEEQCEFFSHYKKVKGLIIRGWEKISDNTLRCISFTMGEQLEELDVSFSHVSVGQLEVLLARVSVLRVVRFTGCPLVNGACINLLARMACKTVDELYVDKCPLFKEEPLLWLAGIMGISSPKLSKLQVLDLQDCPITDDGLIAVSTCCSSLRYLNLQNCEVLTDRSLCAIFKANKELRLINLNNVTNVSTKSIICIGKNCRELLSINLNQCERIGNKGIDTLGANCLKLQAINLAGLSKLDERPLCTLTNNCHGLSMLNVTGVPAVTVAGLEALIMGMDQVRTHFHFISSIEIWIATSLQRSFLSQC